MIDLYRKLKAKIAAIEERLDAIEIKLEKKPSPKAKSEDSTNDKGN